MQVDLNETERSIVLLGLRTVAFLGKKEGGKRVDVIHEIARLFSDNSSAVEALDPKGSTIAALVKKVEGSDNKAPANCRFRQMREGRSYPRHSCERCGLVLKENFACPFGLKE